MNMDRAYAVWFDSSWKYLVSECFGCNCIFSRSCVILRYIDRIILLHKYDYEHVMILSIEPIFFRKPFSKERFFFCIRIKAITNAVSYILSNPCEKDYFHILKRKRLFFQILKIAGSFSSFIFQSKAKIKNYTPHWRAQALTSTTY